MAILDLQAAVRNVIGTDVQAWDAQLDDIAALDVTQNDNFLVSDGANWTQETPTQVRTTLGLIAGGAGDIWVEKAGDTMTGTLNISVPTTTDEALILQTTDDNRTTNIFEMQDSGGTAFVKARYATNSAGIDPVFDIVSGKTGMMIGGTNNTIGTRTDGVGKVARIVWPHATNAEQPHMLLYATGPQISFGGGTSYGNAVTRTKFFTATNSTTLNGTERMVIEGNGDVGIGADSPSAQLHLDQSSSTAAQPVLLLDQADVSEEMIEFATTIGVGNAIEAVGVKTLTTTHFIKVTLPGSLTRYIPVGSIA